MSGVCTRQRQYSLCASPTRGRCVVVQSYKFTYKAKCIKYCDHVVTCGLRVTSCICFIERKSRRQKSNIVTDNKSAPQLIHHTLKVPVVTTPSSTPPALVVGECSSCTLTTVDAHPYNR